jgi:hypothetical protein
VLGQTVRFNKQTVFRGTTREAIAVGDDVAVSGWYLDSGEFLASLVRRSGTFAPGGEAEVKGIIEALDTVARSFRIGGLAIVYGPSTEIEMKDDRDELLPSDNGVFVEVEGTFNGSVLIAEEIEQEDDRNLLGASGWRRCRDRGTDQQRGPRQPDFHPERHHRAGDQRHRVR